MRRVRPLLMLGFALACAGAAQQDAGTRGDPVQELIESGRLDEAERLARAGSDSLAVTLGEVLVLRGKLAEAESLFLAAVEAQRPGFRRAFASLAELALRRGERGEALRRAAVLADEYQLIGARWSPDDKVAAGRAFVVLGLESSSATRSALAAFDAAAAMDPHHTESRLRAADLLLDRYNAPDARESYREVLSIRPDHPRALLGLARVLSFEGSGAALDSARRSLEHNPSLVGAHLVMARLHLEAEAYDSAAAAAGRALAVDSTALQAWAVLGSVAWLAGDSTAWQRARAEARRIHPRPADFYAELAEAAARHRRYAQAVEMATEAARLDSLSARAHGVLGTNQLRVGAMEQGRESLERAFALDPFHVWHKNTLDLLDNLRGFTTIRTARFEFVAPADEAALLVSWLGPLMEEAYDSLARRYDYRPPAPVRMELYRHHADFSVRTVGLAGLGALGVSFGTVLAMDAPSARNPGDFNWGSTAWHELAHTFTLGLSGHRVPRWYSEGLSVLEERRARPGWGADVSPEFLATFKAGRLLPVSRINEGFVRPRHGAEIAFSYYQASLVCELIEQQHGERALRDLLVAYGEGLDTDAAFQRVLGTTPSAFDRQFEQWLRQRFRVALAGLDPWDGRQPVQGGFVAALLGGRQHMAAGRTAEARRELERARDLFPEFAGQSGPRWDLARLHHQDGNRRAALQELSRITEHDETALAANTMEAELRQQEGDQAAAAAALERTLWISPYDQTVHSRLAELRTDLGQHSLAVRHRRAVLQLRPADRLEARYQLARALARAGEIAEARREVLGILEQAPGFEKAQVLLLELRGGGGG